ncbi:MAG: CheR family methyltransferase [Armatimonadota bacterium]
MQNLAAIDYERFKTNIRERTGLDLNAYKQNQMERRLRSAMERAGARSFGHYYRMLDTDDTLLKEFMDRVTINVSELFRNPEQFKVLEGYVIPDLMDRSSSIRAWSAGCSYGQEVYSVAACLKDAAPNRAHSIMATDIDEKALAHARKGVFTPLDARNLEAMKKDHWFRCEGESVLPDESLRPMIRIQRLDLLTDAFPTKMDLILCRNVVIYFTESAKDRLYRRFYDALKPGGFLFVGGTERINGYVEMGYKNPFPFFYQKPLNQ